jgi:hypothetical protein
MILRRITEHVKAQNWFAVGIDFLIVVVGVFIGIQVANWNVARTKQIDAAAARERLISDLWADRDAFAVRRQWYEEVFTAALRVDDALRAASAESRDAMWRFVRDAWIAGGEWPFAPSAQVYKELQNAGDLGLIASGAMQRRLRDYYEDSAREIEITLTFKSNYADLTHLLIEGRIGIAMTGCLSAASLEPSQPGTSPDLFYKDCPPPDNMDQIADSARALYTSESLRGVVNARLNKLSGLLSLLEYLDRQAVSLIADLEAAP